MQKKHNNEVYELWFAFCKRNVGSKYKAEIIDNIYEMLKKEKKAEKYNRCWSERKKSFSLTTVTLLVNIFF